MTTTAKKFLQEIEVDAYLADTVQIEPLALEEEFIRLPADLAYWNERYSQAVRAFLISKIEVERCGARLHLEVRTRLMGVAVPEGAKSKGPTVADIEAAVESEPELQAARMRALDAEVDKVRLQGVLDAVRAKRDMLVQLGARARIEMEADPVIRDRIQARQAQRDLR